MADYRLVNAVGGGDLGVEVDLHNSVEQLSFLGPSYNPEMAPGLHFKLPKTAVTVMIFRTGNYHLTGAEGVEQLERAYEELIEIVDESLSLKPARNGVDVRNLVYSGEFGQEFELPAIASDLTENVEYDPAVNPGLKFRFADKKGVFTLYRTGAYTYTGQSDAQKAQKALDRFQEVFCSLANI